MNDNEIKVALVTGSSAGIGEASAIEFARAGYKVFASMRDTSKFAALAQLAAKEELDLECLELDVKEDASMRSAVSALIERAGQIDVLVNNAGIPYAAPVEFLEDAPFREVMETNFFGATKMMQLVVPFMRQRGSGTIVNISSIAGRFAHPCQGPYCASKFALEGMAMAMASEVASFGVRVVLIEPGVVNTSIVEKLEQMKQGPPPPEGFPYTPYLIRLLGLLDTWLKNEVQSEDVAKVVVEAAAADAPKLRYVIGPDAHAQARMLAECSDELRTEFLATPDVEAFMRRAGEFGFFSPPS